MFESTLCHHKNKLNHHGSLFFVGEFPQCSSKFHGFSGYPTPLLRPFDPDLGAIGPCQAIDLQDCITVLARHSKAGMNLQFLCIKKWRCHQQKWCFKQEKSRFHQQKMAVQAAKMKILEKKDLTMSYINH